MPWRFRPDFTAAAVAEDDLKLAVALGYRYVLYQIGKRPVTEYVLPLRPFKKLGPLVLVTEKMPGGEVKHRRTHKLRFITKRQVRRRWVEETRAVQVLDRAA